MDTAGVVMVALASAGVSLAATAYLLPRKPPPEPKDHPKSTTVRVQEFGDPAGPAEPDAQASELVLQAMERSGVRLASEATTVVVALPDDAFKGRLIGRDGRNVRAFEQATGADLIIDDTPSIVVVSAFDPLRRETARMTLERLVADGRIQPARIQEALEQASAAIAAQVPEHGHVAARDAAAGTLSRPLAEAVGRLRFRRSYGQNVLDHSVEVARLAGELAAELRFDGAVCRRAALLHDIGKGLPPEHQGPHALTGAAFLRALREPEEIAHAVEAHHLEVAPRTAEARIVALADALSAARPGARRENLEGFLQRVDELEDVARATPGVAEAYAVQGGKELRVVVRPEEIDDAAAAQLARTLARDLGTRCGGKASLKVTVIRETRHVEVSR